MNPFLGLLLRLPLHGLGLFVWLLPRRAELALGRLLGRVAFRLDFKRRPIVEENLRRCLPELPLGKRRALALANYEHYGKLGLELAHMFTPLAGHWGAYARRNCELVGFDHWRAANAKGKGVLLCSLHLGNWEIMGASGALGGMAVTAVTRRLKPAWLHEWMVAKRLETGARCAIQPRTMGAVMKAIKSGETVGFVMDQYMLPPMGAPLIFFGAEVHTLTALAPLARRTGAAIVPVKQVRGDDGVVRVTFEPEFELTGDDAADNQRLADIVERWVREEPEQWLWAHRRFKHAVWPAAVPAGPSKT